MMRATFRVSTITQTQWAREVSMYAVSDADSANNQFARHSPTGKLTMVISDPAAADFLEVGQDYYLDFTHAGGPS